MALDLDQITQFGESILRKDPHGRKHSKPRLNHLARCIFLFGSQEPNLDPFDQVTVFAGSAFALE